MPIPTYTPGYPPDGSSLGQTKAVIRNNLDGTFQTLNVDHVNNNGQPGSQPAGYHTIIHQVTQTSVNTVTGYNQLFSGVPGSLIVNGVATPAIPNNGDTQLYALSGQGGFSQLTGANGAINGYTWMGGVLLQWGQVGVVPTFWPITPQTVTFTSQIPAGVAFPNNLFNVVVTFTGGPSSSSGDISILSLSKTGFTWVFTGSSNSSFSGFYWVAIGN